MKKVDIEVSKLKECEYNPRKISDGRLEQLKHSLTVDREFLDARPLIVNCRKDGSLVVVGGNQRLKAAVALGWERVPCVLVELDEQKEKIWNLADNNEYGEWDNELLTPLLDGLFADGVDISLAGFDSVELNSINLLSELEDVNFMKSLSDSSNYFSITLTFNNDFKELIEGYVKKNGKEGLSSHIIKLCGGKLDA